MAVTAYSGVYRAVCLEVLPDRVRVQIPQLFASEIVTAFECAGERPHPGNEGWVSFESGMPEHPVWVGSESVAPAAPGSASKFAAALNGTASPEVVTHNLGTRDVSVTVLKGVSPYTAVDVDWDATTVNTVTIRYNPNLGAGYRVVVG